MLGEVFEGASSLAQVGGSDQARILDLLVDAVCVVDANWTVQYANRAFHRLVNLPTRQIAAQTLWEVWPAAADSEIRNRWERALQTQCNDSFESLSDVHGAWLSIHCHPSDGGLVLHLRECTKRKLAEEALRKSDVRMRSLFDTLPAGAVLVDGQSISVNAKVEQMLGYPQDSFVTLDDWFRITRGGDKLAAASGKQDYIQVKRLGFREGQIRELRHADGTTRIVDISAWEDELGEVWLLYDLTDRLASEEKFRVLFEKSSDAHAVTDEHGVVDCNDAALTYFGFESRDQILGTKPSNLSPDFQPDGLSSVEKSAAMNEIAGKHGHHRFEWVHKSLDGRLLPCEVTLTDLTIGGKMAQLITWRDLTAQKETEARLRAGADELRRMADEIQAANEQLIEARDAALESARAKTRFLATMSHEIRTPLNGVVGMTNLLLRTQLTKEQDECVRTIQVSGQTLLRVINDILDLSKIEAGKLTVETSRVDLVSILGEVVSLFKSQASEKQLILSKATAVGSLIVMADEIRIKQIIGNLVMNAIKFTQRGEIEIRMRLGDLDGEIQKVILSVEDTGIGIPPDRLSAVFDSFTEADGSTHRQYGGTGLGLTIAKRLTELMGGTISVESTLGKGTRFTVELPVVLWTRSATPEPIGVEEEPKYFPGLRVLVAEDNQVNMLVAKRSLEALGCLVTLVSSGTDAVRLAGTKEFDIILMDLQMPGGDGIEATRHILRKNPSAKVIALTANAMPEDREACISAGMIGFITKPVLVDELALILDEAVGES
jgi:PAS domain S-box-containing protein